MATVLTLQEFSDLTDQRIGEIGTGVEDRQSDMIPEFYTQRDSDLITERGSALTPMGNLSTFTGQGRIDYDGPSQGFDWQATHVERAKGIQIQRRLWRFDLFSMIDEIFELLFDSGFETRQSDAAQFFVEGHSNTSLLNFTHSRGEAPFANTHTSPIGSVGTTGTDNLITGALSRGNLNTIRTMGATFRDDAGRVRGVPFDLLIIPPQLGPQAEVLMDSSKEPDTANNAINPNFRRMRIVEWEQLTDPNDYIVASSTRLKQNLRWFEADPLEMQRVLDFDTQIAKYAIYGQWTTAWRDWRNGVKARVT